MVRDFEEFERILTISGVMGAEDGKAVFCGERDIQIQAFARATSECEKRTLKSPNYYAANPPKHRIMHT